MPKKKVAVALSDWLLVELDDAAAEADLSRSALVEEAVAEYVTRHRSHAEERAYRERAVAALQDAKAFAAECAADPACADEPSTLEKLRALRADGRGIGK
ncbi:MAG: ribbon-helix-helix protein, CopG family [Actinobacteria bacterium]|nr:MAG: ribbon-helix-helix protein, CopG family [Actinomycetota bacterium]